MSVITISRECGVDSEEVASLLAQKLGWEYIGKHLVARIARELRISEGEAEAFLQDAQSRLLRFVDRYTCSLIQKVVDRERGCLDDESYFKTVKKLVEDGNLGFKSGRGFQEWTDEKAEESRKRLQEYLMGVV